MHKRKKQQRHFRTPLLLLASCVVYLYWQANALQLEHFHFASPRLPAAFDGFRIVQLSDLHGESFGRDNCNLADMVAGANPDMIALTGDFADSDSTIDDVEPLIRSIVTLAPVYYVTGNHEWAAGLAEEMLAMMRRWGVICLENEYVPLMRDGEKILIAGVHDPNGYADQKSPETLAAEMQTEMAEHFCLLLAHRNTLFASRYSNFGADLTLCGHGHGGIWRLPLTDGVFGANMQFLPTHTSGFYQYENADGKRTDVFVSRGLGDTPPFPRINNRPQVAVITLTCTKGEREP